MPHLESKTKLIMTVSVNKYINPYLSPKTQEICISCVSNFNNSALATTSIANSLLPIAQSPKTIPCTIYRTSAHTALVVVLWPFPATPLPPPCRFSPPFAFRLSPLTYPDTPLWWYRPYRGWCVHAALRYHEPTRYPAPQRYPHSWTSELLTTSRLLQPTLIRHIIERISIGLSNLNIDFFIGVLFLIV